MSISYKSRWISTFQTLDDHCGAKPIDGSTGSAATSESLLETASESGVVPSVLWLTISNDLSWAGLKSQLQLCILYLPRFSLKNQNYSSWQNVRPSLNGVQYYTMGSSPNIIHLSCILWNLKLSTLMESLVRRPKHKVCCRKVGGLSFSASPLVELQNLSAFHLSQQLEDAFLR